MQSRCISAKILASLTAREPLIAHFLMRSEIVESGYLPKNACVGITIENNRIILFINPERFQMLTELEQAGVLLHEYLHPLLGHCTTRTVSDHRFDYMLNVAQDMAINQLVVKTLAMPAYAVFHNSLGFDFEPLKSAEYYFNKLMEDIPKFESVFGPLENPNPEHSVDSHDGWKHDTNSKKVVKQIAKEYASSANPHIGQVLAGTEHANILDTIAALNTSGISWMSQILHLINSVDSDTRTLTYKRPNRRFEEFLPGSRTELRPKIAVALDTSGSMRNILPSALNEINRLADIAEIDIYQCDVEITKIIKGYTAGKTFEVSGYGGTLLQPAFTAAHESGAEAIICITDGGITDETIETFDMSIIWAIYNNPTFMPSVGKLIRIEA